MERFHLTRREGEDGVQVIEVHGELDLAVAARLGDELAAIPLEGDVLIDLSACEFVDSTGIATILVARRELHGADRRLALVGASGQVRRLFQLVGLDRDGLLIADGAQIAAA